MSARPELAVHVARIAAGWSRMEQRLGFILVDLLGPHAHTGITMYKALSGSASQMAVFRAVARDRLRQDKMDELEKLLRRLKKVAGMRNNVIHGLWEFSDQLPDALVWCGSAEQLLAHSEFWAGWTAHDELTEQMDWALKFNGKQPTYLVYEAKDFEEISSEMQSLLNDLLDFNIACKERDEPLGEEPSLTGA